MRPNAPNMAVLRPALAWLALATAACAAEATKGEAIYKAKCASCHGAFGEGGTEEYPNPLAGDRSVAQLARLIAKTMPSDDPGTCTGAEADKVAAYIFDTFYSRAARDRNAPPRVELSRLTVRQYRNSLADLVGSFREAPKSDDRRGLRGEYSKSRRNGTPALDRVDPEVRFDFGKASPVPEIADPKEYAIRWTGTVTPPETGEYDFIVRTENSARLWVNDPVRPLIDASVKSGSDTEYRGTVRLLGGRAYAVRLEYSKAKQGVKDSKEKQEKLPVLPGSVALEWVPPGRVAEVIPARCLSPGKASEAFVSTAPFPPDDRSVGYERGTSVSKAWDQATTDGAIEAADTIVAHLRELAGASETDGDREAKLKAFCRTFASRAFRRPLGDDQARLYVDRQFEGVKDKDQAAKRSILLVLKSPRFLYREPSGERGDGYDAASRLSFGMWDSLPDKALLDAAASGGLKTAEQVASQAGRMVDDPRARAKIREFFFQWLRVESAPDLSKDTTLFPGFDKAVVADLRTSLELTLDDILWGDDPDFRRLLLSDEVFLNGRLAKFYGTDGPADAPFRKVKLDPSERAGVISHPYLLATFAYTAAGSPIHRGVFISRSLLGRALRPPPEAVAPLAPDLHAGLSNRERVALQTSPTACMSCHGMINPLGFGLERFDAVGRLRLEERGKPVDASGTYEPPSGDLRPYSGARGLATLLAESDETQSAFVDQFFHHLVKQPIRAYGPKTRADLRRSFAASGTDIRKLAVAIVAASATPPASASKSSNP